MVGLYHHVFTKKISLLTLDMMGAYKVLTLAKPGRKRLSSRETTNKRQVT